MSYSHIDVSPVTGAIGAQIDGVNLAHDLDGDCMEEIRRAFLEHQVIFFRGQDLTPERQMDDEEVIVTLGKIALGGHGYNVTTSTDPRQALKIFKANPDRFDLVVTDQGMPHLRGDQLAAKMRKTRADIPIILCTGYSETMTPESSKAMGINAFLYKPLEPQELGRVVREVLDKSK